jgi:hypothetical protein
MEDRKLRIRSEKLNNKELYPDNEAKNHRVINNISKVMRKKMKKMAVNSRMRVKNHLHLMISALDVVDLFSLLQGAEEDLKERYLAKRNKATMKKMSRIQKMDLKKMIDNGKIDATFVRKLAAYFVAMVAPK